MITLDTPLGVAETFASSVEADEYLESNSAWNAASDEVKGEALIAARYFIDGMFSCKITGAIPDALKFANSLLAADYVSDKSSFQSTENIRRQRVKAGSVESENYYNGSSKRMPPSWFQVKSVLQEICVPSGVGTVFLTRA